MHRCTAAQMYRCASTVLTMEYFNFLCLPNIYCFTNFFVGQLFCTKEVFHLFSNLLPPLGDSFFTYRIWGFAACIFFRTSIEDLFFRQGKNHSITILWPIKESHEPSSPPKQEQLPISNSRPIRCPSIFCCLSKINWHWITASTLKKRPINLQLFPYSSKTKDA